MAEIAKLKYTYSFLNPIFLYYINVFHYIADTHSYTTQKKDPIPIVWESSAKYGTKYK